MGKKGRCLSVLNRVCIFTSTEEPLTTTKHENTEGRKTWDLRKLRRAPSSIEEILEEAEIERCQTATIVTAKIEEKSVSAAPAIQSPDLHDPLETVHEEQGFYQNPCCTNEEEQQVAAHSEPPLPIYVAEECAPAPPSVAYHRNDSLGQNAAAIKIQTAFRGYLARRSYRRMKGLARLESMLESQNVQRQTTTTMRCMQQLVRVQTQISARRSQTLESQKHLRGQSVQKDDKELEYENSNQQEDWDDSILSKEETDARLQRKVEAATQRERVLAYSYSHQASKHMSRSARALLIELKSAQLPWGWNWNQRRSSVQLVTQYRATSGETKSSVDVPLSTASSFKRIQPIFEPMMLDVPTPRSSRSPLATRGRSPKPASVGGSPCHRNHRVSSTTPLRDDESLTSCPPFHSPNYMSPTISAMAKVNDRSKAQGLEPTKRRLSFGSTKSPFSPISCNRGHTNFSSNEANSQKMSVPKGFTFTGNYSINSAVSLPVGVARKPYR